MIRIHIMPALEEAGVPADKIQAAYGGESAAIDLYAASETEIPPHGTALVPTGIRIALEPGFVALVKERGSVTKTPLALRAGVIDPGYTGEIFIGVWNHSDKPFIYQTGERTHFQLLTLPCDNNYSQVSLEEFENAHSISKRGAGALGSSN